MNTKHQVPILNLILILQVGIAVSKNKKISSALGVDGSREIIQMEKMKGRIVGGYEVRDLKKFGYQAEYGYFCAGAILGDYWVISAAHCGEKEYVRVGSKYLDEGTLYPIAKYVFHPAWINVKKPHAFEMDIVLLNLERPLIYNKYVYPIKIGKVKQLSVGLMLTVSGWGFLKFNAGPSRVLQAVQLPIIKQSTCQKIRIKQYNYSLTDNMFCAGFKTGLKDACQGDSGAPAVANKRLFGLVSFGYKCALPNMYGAYTKVGKAIPWIEKVTNLNVT